MDTLGFPSMGDTLCRLTPRGALCPTSESHSPRPDGWGAVHPLAADPCRDCLSGWLADGMTDDAVLGAYPDLEAEDVREALRYAAEAVREREIPVISRG